MRRLGGGSPETSFNSNKIWAILFKILKTLYPFKKVDFKVQEGRLQTLSKAKDKVSKSITVEAVLLEKTVKSKTG